MTQPGFRRYFRHGFLPQLIAFDACVRHGSVTRAAQELCLAQPTVSGLLRKLADTVGEPLLRFGGGCVELTGAGREVARLCGEMLEALERFEDRRGSYPHPGPLPGERENFVYPSSSQGFPAGLKTTADGTFPRNRLLPRNQSAAAAGARASRGARE